jgi:YVTN family beta-propeller protein
MRPWFRAALAVAFLARASVAQDTRPPAYAVVSRLPGPDGGWDLASVDPAAQRLYVARTDGVMAIDLARGTVIPQLVASQRGHAALAIPGTREVMSTNGAANTAIIFDGQTGQLRATIPTGTKPDAVAFDPATQTLWIMNPGSGDITVVDPRTALVRATVPVGGSLEMGGASGQGQLYVNVEDRNEVAVIDTRGRKVISRFPLKGCEGPTGLAYAPDRHLIISACANGVAVISSPNGRQMASLTVGPRPDGALYDAARHLAFVPSGGDGTLAVIDLASTPKMIARVQTAKGARTAALDPSSGRIYLPSAQFAPPVGNARPQPVAGTFAVLVVAPVAKAP